MDEEFESREKEDDVFDPESDEEEFDDF